MSSSIYRLDYPAIERALQNFKARSQHSLPTSELRQNLFAGLSIIAIRLALLQKEVATKGKSCSQISFESFRKVSIEKRFFNYWKNTISKKKAFRCRLINIDNKLWNDERLLRFVFSPEKSLRLVQRYGYIKLAHSFHKWILKRKYFSCLLRSCFSAKLLKN